MFRRLLVLGGGGAAATAGYNYMKKKPQPVVEMEENKFVNNLNELNNTKIEYEDALSPKDFKPFKLKEIKTLTHDSAIFTFALEDNQDGLAVPLKMNVPVASCIVAKGDVDGETVIRPYTPINRPSDIGFMDLLIKTYPTGKLSKYFHQLKVGDSVEFKGPFVKINYKPNLKKDLAFIVGGTGIAPAFQMIQEVLSNTKEDKTKITLLYANRTPEDVLLKKELDDLANKYPQQFSIYYTVDNDPKNTADASIKGRGFVTEDMIKQANIPQPGENVLVSVCGPAPFYTLLSGQKKSPQEQGELSGLLKQMGYSESNVFKF